MVEFIKKYTFYLFSRPSFVSGAGRIFDFNNSLNEYNTSETPEEADRKAIYLDWLSVGQDIGNAFIEYDKRK